MVIGKSLISDDLKIFFVPKGSITQWRMNNLIPFVMEREDYTCWVDGCYNRASDVHEGIVTRGMVQGWPIKQRLLVHSPLNSVALCTQCHKYAPKREAVLDWMVEQYGRDFMIFYLESLPFKINPVRGLIERIKNE